MENDEKYMSIALELAEKGRGNVSPNPLVGCVIVRNDKVLAKGYHQGFGKEHAEVNAINEVQGNLEGCIVYVTLEPCTHHGKTPPCSDLLIENKPDRVVIATKDANPIVSGNGISALENSGIDVTVGTLEEKARELNRVFNLNMTKKRPYITAKFALTLDGFIAQINHESKWISCEESRREVHKIRSEVDAIIVGSGTVRHDNPQLDVRLAEGKDPMRIVLASHLQLPLKSQLLSDEKAKENTIIFCTNDAQNIKLVDQFKSDGIRVHSVAKSSKSKVSLLAILPILYKEYNIGHILLEGGAKMYSSFYEDNLIDEIIGFHSPKILGNGISPFHGIKPQNLIGENQFHIVSHKQTGDDIMITYRK